MNYRSSVQLTFSSCQAKKPLFENRIPFIPESQTKTQSTLSVSYSKEAIFTPAIDSRSCMVMRKVVPAVKTTFFCSKTKTQKYACYLFSLLWTNLTLPISFKLPSYLKIFYYKAINKDDRQYSGVGWNTTDIFREKFALKVPTGKHPQSSKIELNPRQKRVLWIVCLFWFSAGAFNQHMKDGQPAFR